METDINQQTNHAKIKYAVVAAVVVVFFISAALWGVAQAYEGNVPPRVSLGSVEIGGLNEQSALLLVARRIDEIVRSGILVAYDGTSKTIPLQSLSPDDPDIVRDFATFDTEAFFAKIFSKNRKFVLARGFDTLASMLFKKRYMIDVKIDAEGLSEALEREFPSMYKDVKNAGFQITQTDSVWNTSITDEEAGSMLNEASIFPAVSNGLSVLEPEEIIATVVLIEPEIKAKDIEQFVEPSAKVMSKAPFTIAYKENDFETRRWSISDESLATLLVPVKQNSEIQLGLDYDVFGKWLTENVKDVEVLPRDAKFRMENGRVAEFSPSQKRKKLSDAGVVDQNIQPPELLHRSVHEFHDGAFIRHIPK